MGIEEVLKKSLELDGSDIFIIAGKEISVRIDGSIEELISDKISPDESLQLITELYSLANRDMEKFKLEKDDDFSVSVPDLARFRVNTYHQRGSAAAVIRVVQFGVPDYNKLNIPEEVMKIATMTRGLVLVTGSTGSGKSTTMACIIDAINRTRNAHIITIEDPIEFLHSNEMGIVTQRELAMDTTSYVKALRASLRESPDVIFLGEMRDLETIQIAMTAAETGHLVLSTLHTVGAANTIDRIIDIFPATQQQQIRVELAQVLKKVVSQQLLPNKAKGKRVPAFEIMSVNNAIRTLIRESRIHQIDSQIQLGQSSGMVTMDDSIVKLYKNGSISREVALDYSINSDVIAKKLGA